MAPKYKLTYFPVAGRGEAIRFLLAYGGKEFEDYRIEYEDWPGMKPRMPFGKVPVLEIDGKVVHQSNAICRYLAKELNLAGRNEMEALQIDMVVDTMGDFGMHVIDYYYDTNTETRDAKREPLQKETLPFFMSRFDKMVADNGGYFVGGQLSWADLVFVARGDYLSKLIGIDIYEGYPNLQRLKKTVLNIPQIKAWVEKRPDEIIYTAHIKK